MQVLAEGFSNAGVSVFAADIKGDLSGVAAAGEAKPALVERAKKLGFDYEPDRFPVVFWDLFGKQGHPIRATISEMGPLMLARLMDLNEVQEGVLNIAFRVALRAETAEDSRDVIGSDAALHLPSKENGYALLKVGPRDLEPFRCFYLSAPFVLPKKVANVNRTIDVSFSQPRPLTWEYQPLSAQDSAALAVADEPEEPDEFLFHSDGFKKKKILDVIRESLVSHPARLPHQIWLPPLEVSEPVDALVSYWRGKPWHVDYGQNPGLTLPIGIVDIPEDHTQLVHALDVEMDKAARHTDWSSDTLSPEQVYYAISDVTLLLPLMDKLEAMLQREGRGPLAR